MRGSELHQRYIERITALATAPEPPADWRAGVETVIRQFHSETMPLTRAPFRKLCDDMGAELEAKAQSKPEGRARDVLSLAAELIRKL